MLPLGTIRALFLMFYISKKVPWDGRGRGWGRTNNLIRYPK